MSESIKDFKDVTTEWDYMFTDDKDFEILRTRYPYEYITEHKSDQLTRLNLHILRDMATTFEEFSYTRKLCKIILVFYFRIFKGNDENNQIELDTFRLSKICTSLNEQHEVTMYMQYFSKNIPLDKKLYKLFKRSIGHINSRLLRLNELMLKYYITITPLYYYNEILNKMGISLRDDMLLTVGKCTYSEYIETVLFVIGNKDEEIQRSIEERKVTISKFIERKDTIRKDEARKLNDHKYQHASKLLTDTEENIRNNLDVVKRAIMEHGKFVIPKGGFSVWIKFSRRINEFKRDNNCEECKIFIYKNLRSSKDNVYYYRKDSTTGSTYSVGVVSIYSIDESIPTELLEDHILCKEIIF